MKIIRIGTRASRLAMVQAQMVADAIERARPELNTELVPIKTTGDKILDKPLELIGGKGVFVKELDQALRDERVDITVHSCKDLPLDVDKNLPLVAVSVRGNAHDALVLPAGVDEVDCSLPLGCSSSRRRIQLKTLFPHCETQGIRGNVLTRLEKLDRGEYSALVLAAAGLERLGLEERISTTFSIKEMLPAACQGTLAVQARAGEDISWLDEFNDADTFRATVAERAFIRALDGGCTKPSAAYAEVRDGHVLLQGMYVSDDETSVRFDTVLLAFEGLEQQAARFAERMKSDV